MKMPSFKQSILLVRTPAILAVGGLSAIGERPNAKSNARAADQAAS